jgi:hypothetical protein
MSRFAIIAGILLAACSYPPSLPPVPVPALKDSPLLGCWSLAALGIDSLFLKPPGGVRLVDSAAASADGSIEHLVLHVGTGIRRGRLPPHTSWTFVARDSAQLYWGDGFVGFAATVAVRGDTLSGQGHTYSDVVGAEPRSRRVVGHRVQCSDVGL